jgi:hypothetical protein
MMQLFRQLQERHANMFLSVRYEDLVDRTEQTVRHCCEFAGIPFEQGMLDPSQWSVKGPKEYESRGIVARNDKWRDAAGADLETVKQATEACFPSACHFGYLPE